MSKSAAGQVDSLANLCFLKRLGNPRVNRLSPYYLMLNFPVNSILLTHLSITRQKIHPTNSIFFVVPWGAKLAGRAAGNKISKNQNINGNNTQTIAPNHDECPKVKPYVEEGERQVKLSSGFLQGG